MLVATNGEETYRVNLVHWWPGRKFRNRNRTLGLFFEMKHKKGTRYATVAFIHIAEEYGSRVFSGVSLCCPKDQPSRGAGRFIALLRLARALRKAGYRLECREKGAGDAEH